MTTFSIAQYWEDRYRKGGISGAGSRGEEAEEKAALVNRMIRLLGVRSVLDLGCGDGVVADKIIAADYTGCDPSETALELCRARMPGRRFLNHLPDEGETFDMTLSLDVIFHQVDDVSFHAHLAALLGEHTRRWALVYGTDREERGAPHVRHRRWTHRIPRVLWDVEMIASPLELTGARKGAWLLTRKGVAAS